MLKNTSSQLEFAFDSFFLGIMISIIYKVTVFKTIPGLNYALSELLFWGWLTASLLLGVMVLFRAHRNLLSAAVNAVMPLNCYALLSNYNRIGFYFWLVLSIASGVSFFLIMLLNKKCKDMGSDETTLKRIHNSFILTVISFTCCFFVLTLSLVLFSSSQSFRTSLSNQSEQELEDDQSFGNELAKYLNGDYEGDDLSKMKVLQAVANREQNNNSIQHELLVETRMLPGTILAEYDDLTHIITIDTVHFTDDPPEEVLNSLLHEVYHAVEHRLCDAFDSIDEQYKDMPYFATLQCYKDEFSTIKGHGNTMDEYFFQKTEIDARAYAEEMVEWYIDFAKEMEVPLG